MNYTGIERTKNALLHKESDRVPFDIGGAVVTSVAISVYRDLIKELGLPEREIRTRNLYSQTAELDEDVLSRLGVDTRPAVMGENKSADEILTKENGRLLFQDDWGFKYSKKEGSLGGFELIYNPLYNAETENDIENYLWPKGNVIENFAGLNANCINTSQVLQKAVILEGGSPGVFELACWLRGMENFLIDMATNKPFAQSLINRIVQYKLEFWGTALQVAGGYIDIVRESDDLGSQNSLLISCKMYEEFIMPAHKKIFDLIHSRTDAAVCLHSCGAIREIIPKLIQIGVDVLNPVQTSATGMDPLTLKNEFGDDIVFWGGSICSQTQLSSEKPEKIIEIAKKNIEIFGKKGGYIFAPINMIQHDVPAKNVIALSDAVIG